MSNGVSKGSPVKHSASDAAPLHDPLGPRLAGLLRAVWHALAQPIPWDRKAAARRRQRAGRRQQAHETRTHTRRMQHDLYQLLNRHPDSRRLMRNLYRVERALRHGGIAALEAAPSKVLVRALDEMERLVWDWSPVGLAELRSRIAVLLKARPAGEGVDNAASSQAIDLVDFEQAHRGAADQVDVSEVEHSDFEEMERNWIAPPIAPAPGG